MTYAKPNIDILQPQVKDSDIDEKYMEDMKNAIQNELDQFLSNVKVIRYKKSPLNIIFDIEIGTGTKYKEVTDLTRNIEVRLGSPAKFFQKDDESNVVGLAVPHSKTEIVRLRTVLDSKEFSESDSPLTIAAGVDERSNPVVVDLEESPHMMIAGSTGSGKTIFLDDIIISLLFKSTPDQVKLLLVDPIKSDFKVYEGLPHLICPVLSNKAEISDALSRVAEEINTRNRRFVSFGKTIQDYNAKNAEKLPAIVIIIDKFMDLNIEMPKDFKISLNKISSQGRSAGVHLIINTQSPTSDYVDGTLKNNLTNRVVFSLSSGAESRSAIDRTGAEKLMGSGDMILKTIGADTVTHAKASYISYNEVKEIVKCVKKSNPKSKGIDDYRDVHKDYVILENRDYMKKILEMLHSEHSNVISIKLIQDSLNVQIQEAYEIVNILESNGFIDTYSNGYHKVDSYNVSEALKELDKL